MWNFLLSRTWFSAILSLPLKCFLAVSKSVCLCKFNVTCENKKVPFLPIMATHSCVSAYKPSISLCWIKYRYLLLCPFFSFCKCMYYLKKIYDEIIIYFFLLLISRWPLNILICIWVRGYDQNMKLFIEILLNNLEHI